VSQAEPRRPKTKVDLAPPPHESAATRKKTVAEIAALVRLADLDATLLGRADELRNPVYDEVADERHALGARLSPEILEAYERALLAGRQPAVVRLVASVCSGCHVRLHSTLDQKIRLRQGVAPCPHCLRLAYDPAWQ
jgi:predicted  nucleic acid-binding Zn-ribbon protein